MLLVAMLAWTLAQLTWRLAPMAEGLPVSGTQPALSASAGKEGSASRPSGLEQVAALHLFGDAEAPPAAAEQAPIDAPETRLNLTLKGLVALDSQEEALAIIAKGQGDEQAYKVGETVPGGAVLHEIYADRVILQRGGRFETLTLPKERMAGEKAPATLTTNRTPASLRPPEANRSRPPSTRRLQAVRESILNNPQEAMQLINAQPVMDGGQLKGYRVNPGRDRRLFSSVGLRPGDIVTSVNGIPLSDRTQMGKLFDQLTSAAKLDVTVERGGQQSQLFLNLE
jgi:general secretion pathway protein C